MDDGEVPGGVAVSDVKCDRRPVFEKGFGMAPKWEKEDGRDSISNDEVHENEYGGPGCQYPSFTQGLPGFSLRRQPVHQLPFGKREL